MTQALRDVWEAGQWDPSEPKLFRKPSEAGPYRDPAVATVPQEHSAAAANDSLPRDWSHLGRRVLAEAWRRLMDERCCALKCAMPAVPAPLHADEDRPEVGPPDCDAENCNSENCNAGEHA
jgi:hypothetical protein